MLKINSDEQLNSILKKAVDNSGKESIKIMAGHLPMVYRDTEDGERSIRVDPYRWGTFSMYTFELGVKLLRHVLDSDKEGGLFVVVDDIVELPEKDKEGKKTKAYNDWMKRKRRYYYNTHADLPYTYRQTLLEYDLSEALVIPQMRDDEHASILISEKMLRANAYNRKLTASNTCSQAYKGLIYDSHFFDMKKDQLVSFVPGQCKGNICDGLLDSESNLDAVHVFFPHMEDLGGIVATREGYKKIREPMTLPEIFQSGVYFREDRAKR